MTQVIQLLQWNQVIKTDLFFLSDFPTVLDQCCPVVRGGPIRNDSYVSFHKGYTNKQVLYGSSFRGASVCTVSSQESNTFSIGTNLETVLVGGFQWETAT